VAPGADAEPGPPGPRSVVDLVAAGILDVELAALLWLLVEARLPLLVAGPRGAGRSTLLGVLTDFLPAGTRRRTVGGADEAFAWLPGAVELGWPGGGAAPADRPERAGPAATYLLCPELAPDVPDGAWGLRARVLVRALQLGYGLGTTIEALSLAEVFARLAPPPVELSVDELRRLSVVLVLRADDAGRRRVAAAHYLRPLERDGAGHVQRRPPAVLATWDPARETFDHFGWGVIPELAARVGRPAVGFEREQADRARFLRALVSEGLTEPSAVRSAIAGYRAGFVAIHRH